MAALKPAHFVLVPIAAWGHVRPFLHLSLNLLSVHPSLHLTFLVAPSVSPPITLELASPGLAHIHTPNSAGNEAIIDRLQIINVTSQTIVMPEIWRPTTMAEEADDYAELFPDFLKPLLNGDKEINGSPHKFHNTIPSLLIFDLFQGFVPDVVSEVCEAINKPVIPMFGFFASNVVASYHHFASAESDGWVAIMQNRVKADIAKDLSAQDSWAAHGFAGYGKVKQLPGLQPMYDYEIFPLMGSMPMPPQVSMQISGMRNAAIHPNTTALIATAMSELEPEAHAAIEAELGKPLLACGLQFPEMVWKGDTQNREFFDAEDNRILSFLDRMEAKHGKNSVFYAKSAYYSARLAPSDARFSFGSQFWPVLKPELVPWLLESLHENHIPFLFSHASPFAQLPQNFIEKIEAQEDSCIIKFAPQLAVLQHPATGCFVSHCGYNSCAEATVTETPLICTPFAADQGEFTAIMVEQGVAIDLKQIKSFKTPDLQGDEKFSMLYDGTEVIGTEEAIKKEMTETWARVRGPEGEEMKGKMKALRAVYETSWREGKSRETMEGIAKYF